LVEHLAARQNEAELNFSMVKLISLVAFWPRYSWLAATSAMAIGDRDRYIKSKYLEG
jgi:hypothetical protein